MQKEILISWFAEDADHTVKDEHREALAQRAEESIKRRVFVGDVAGRICEKIPLADGGDAVYEGHWSVSSQILQ